MKFFLERTIVGWKPRKASETNRKILQVWKEHSKAETVLLQKLFFKNKPKRRVWILKKIFLLHQLMIILNPL